MKFATHNQGPVGVDGTRLIGTMQAQVFELERVFGPSMSPTSDPDKITHEWRIKFEDGMLASVYTWNQPEPTKGEVVVWRVGARGVFALPRVHEAFRAGLRASRAA